MERLRELCGGLGFRNVGTYVQSGNIVFQAPIENPAALSKRIGETINDSFGFDATVFVGTSEQIRKVIANNPVLKEKGTDLSKLHVTFLSETAQKSSQKKPRSTPSESGPILRSPPVRFVCCVPEGMEKPDSPTVH